MTPGTETPEQDPSGIDAVLDRAEATIGRLADGRLPLEQLVVAYEEAGSLLAEAATRFAELRERAGGGG